VEISPAIPPLFYVATFARAESDEPSTSLFIFNRPIFPQ